MRLSSAGSEVVPAVRKGATVLRGEQAHDAQAKRQQTQLAGPQPGCTAAAAPILPPWTPLTVDILLQVDDLVTHRARSLPPKAGAACWRGF